MSALAGIAPLWPGFSFLPERVISAATGCAIGCANPTCTHDTDGNLIPRSKLNDETLTNGATNVAQSIPCNSDEDCSGTVGSTCSRCTDVTHDAQVWDFSSKRWKEMKVGSKHVRLLSRFW